MRFLSHVRRFQIQLVEPRAHFTQYGDRIVDREGYVAIFSPDQVNQDDLEFAERVFERGGMLYGRTYMMDEVTPTPLINRLSVFDTEEAALREHWDEEFKEHVENTLLQRSYDHGDFRLVEERRLDPPWPNYESFNGTLDEFMQKVATDEHDLRSVLAYERQSLNRPLLVNALQTAIESEERAAMGATEVPV